MTLIANTHDKSLKTTTSKSLPFLKNLLLTLSCLYGLGVSATSLYWGLFKDLPALEYAVQVQDTNAELRHRINVFADGTWLLLGNLITVSALSRIKKKSF